MSAHESDIAGWVATIVEPMVDYPDDLEVSSSTDSQGTIFIDIRVNEEDAGKVIGRQGRVIKAIRTLARAAASRYDAYVEVELLD